MVITWHPGSRLHLTLCLLLMQASIDWIELDSKETVRASLSSDALTEVQVVQGT